MAAPKPFDVTHFASADDFHAWLAEHHAARDVVWVGYWRKGTGRPSLTWEESVDVALCFGWIDGIRRSVDEESYTIRFTPRRKGSVWSRRNVERYRAMLAADRVVQAGADAWAARTDERTGVYSFERKTAAKLPKELEARFREHADAWADWQARPPGYRKQATHWVTAAKREETRERRFRQVVEDCAAGRKIKPLRRKHDD